MTRASFGRCGLSSVGLTIVVWLLMPTPLDAQALQPTVISLPSDVDRVLRDYENAWSGRDAEALANLFTVDGFVLRPGRPLVQGREAILEAYRNSGGALVLRPYGHALAESVAYVVGGFASSDGAPDVGKFVLALRRAASGRWLIAADIDNGNWR